MNFQQVLSPTKIGSMEIKNRFVVAPMGTNYANLDGSVSQRHIDYYTARAKGGYGLIIVEAAAVEPMGAAVFPELFISDDQFIPGLKKLVDEVHRYETKIAIQLMHAGRQTASALVGQQIVAPSALPCPVCREVPRALTTEEVYAFIQTYVAAAVRAKKAGFDAVEVHGANGYLISEFMSGYSNKRVDEFGGTLLGRMKVPIDIVKGIRRETGKDYPILFRMAHDEGVPGGRTTQESRIVVKLLEEASVDAIDITAGTYESIYLAGPGRDMPFAANAAAAKDLKSAVRIPVIVVGRINDPFIAEDIIQSGKADLIALGRPSLVDPEFPDKVAKGAIEEIAPCIGCGQGCLGNLFIAQPITCLVNPFCGKEGTLITDPVEQPKKVMVVGGGPGGLEAAWVAAKRGHKVTVYERDDHLGGLFRKGAIAPTKGEITKAIRYFITMGHKYGVDYKVGVEVPPGLVAQEKPDVVILATGGLPLKPDIDGINNPDLAYAVEILEGKKPMGLNVLIIGGGTVGLETADFIASYSRQVTVMDMVPDIGAVIDHISKPFLMKRFHDHGVKTIPNAKVKKILDNGVIYETGGHEIKLDGFDSIILAMGYQSYNPLEEDLKGKVKELYVIGDAQTARTALDATREGAEIACRL